MKSANKNQLHCYLCLKFTDLNLKCSFGEAQLIASYQLLLVY